MKYLFFLTCGFLSTIIFASINIPPDFKHEESGSFMRCWKQDDEINSRLTCLVVSPPELIDGFLRNASQKIPSSLIDSIIVRSEGLKILPFLFWDYRILAHVNLTETSIDLTLPGNNLLKRAIVLGTWKVSLPFEQTLAFGEYFKEAGNAVLSGEPVEIAAFFNHCEAGAQITEVRTLVIKSPNLVSFPFFFLKEGMLNELNEWKNLETLDLRMTQIPFWDRALQILRKLYPKIQILFFEKHRIY